MSRPAASDSAAPRRVAAIAVAAGLALALCAAVGGVVAVLGVWLAQPTLALGVSWWRRSRALPQKAWPALRALAWPPLAMWGTGLVVLALLVAWPLAALRDSGSLAAALALSVAVSAALLALWRTWPLWQEIDREGGRLDERWRQLAGQDLQSWRGLVVAVLVLVLCAGGVGLAWPGLLPTHVRWPMAALYALLSLGLHVWLQKLPAAAALAPPTLVDLFAVTQAEPLQPVPAHEQQQALYEAARNGRVDHALQLLEAGADPHGLPDEDWRDQRSLGVLAAVLPDLRLLRELIARGVDVNHPHRGMTPLLAATRDSWHGRPDAVMTLLANGADPRATDGDGNTALHHAARSSDPGVAALLRDAAADLDALNHDGLSPLALACQAGNWRLAKFLLERGARPEPAEGTPVLLAAAGTEEDDPAGVQLLLKYKARVDARDRQRRSALHEAAQAGHVAVIDALLAAGANLEARDQGGRTPWLDAARQARGSALEHLLASRPDVVAIDAEGRNAVMLACQSERVSAALVRRLLELGIDPAQPDHAGRRAVDIAAEAGRWAVVSALDPAYPLPAAVNDGQGDAVTVLPDRPPLALLRDGLQLGNYQGMAALAALCGPRELGELLHDPTLVLDPGRAGWLLEHGADPEVADAVGDVPMFALLARGVDAVPTLQAMLQHGVSPAGRGGLGRFLAACVQHDHASRGLEQFALELAEHGADPFGPSPAGDPPLALAVRLGWLRLQRWLLEHGVDREARDSHGMTALHLAAALGREGSLKLLIQQGASPESRAADGQTPLGVALSIGRRDLSDWLDWRGWALPPRPLREADVPAAAMAGDADAVRRLLDLGLPVDATDAQGCTGLLRAAGSGHAQVVELLLARGADPQHPAGSGATPLSAAVSMRQGEIVAALLQAGARIEHRLPGGVTVLMLACALGLPDIAARLLAAGADVHAGDAQELAPLHCAALYGFTSRDRARLLALLDTLLLAGAEPDRIAAGAVTPLLLLLGARAEPGTACDEQVVLAGVERLLDEGVVLDVQDPRGFGPLHLAALHGLPLLVQRLLRAGADPDLRDALNRPPREIAVMRGFIDVAGQFEPAVPGVSSMARFLRESR
ncbi:ankyrin repeat domain-containing protein [Stenotrophomonas sp. MMGLT7]|uniref:ankyrin repeat domain-containing protein n=1 Tax=Stenotrophomonas sp. MMGLT7 TaxID=2901227 RepID=UPI001E465CAB|nr:ankyrin repeat domain-containing protein [Stenotrophomonas sp. MMGLT7]MCD7098104.1 ankyrin repeat domain-containing protein [Stenotrophomonas sp. MMGLT7]